MVDQNVRPDQAFNSIQHRRQADQFVHPWKQQVGLGPNLTRETTEQSTLARLKGFELSAEVVDLLGTQRIKWSGEPLFPVGSNVFFFQFHNDLKPWGINRPDRRVRGASRPAPHRASP